MADTADLVVERSALGDLEEIGRGGQGTVSRCPGLELLDAPGPLVAKLYHPNVVASHGVSLRNGMPPLVALRRTAGDTARTLLDLRMVWPLRLVVDGDVGVGVVMREIPDRFFRTITLPSGRTKQVAFGTDQLMRDPAESTALGFPDLDDDERLQLCALLAYQLAVLHRLGVVVGDISGKNVLCTGDAGADSGNRAEIMIVDVDSIRQHDAVSPLGVQGHTPEWEPPEFWAAKTHLDAGGDIDRDTVSALTARRDLQTPQSDVFKFGLFVIRILARRVGATMVRDPSLVHDQLARLVTTARAEAVLEALSPDPADRPTMRAVYEALRG